MRKSIRAQLLVPFVGLAVVPLLLVGVVIGWQNFTAQREQALELQREIAHSAATKVASFVKGLEQELRVAARVRHLSSLDREDQYSVLSRVHSYGDDFEELALLDDRGREQVRVSRLEAFTAADLRERSGADEFVYPVASGETYYSPVSFDDVTGEPFMTMAVPLTNVRSGLVDGVLVANIRLKEIWDLIANISVGEAGTAYILDQHRRVIAHRNPSVVLRGTVYAVPESPGIHTGLSGTNVVLAVEEVRLGDQTLTIVTERPVSEALALTIRTVLITAALILAALVAALVLGFFAVRRIVRPIRALATTAQAINTGELWRQADTTSQDEIGVLARAFNRMTAQLRDIIDSLEQRVSERTKELSEANTALESEIAERKQAERELQRLALAVSNIAEGVVVTDLEGRIEFVNRGLERLLGYKPCELEGRPVSDLFPGGADSPVLREIREGLLAGGWSGEVELQAKNGKRVPTLETASPISDAAGRLTGYVCTNTDISVRKRAEKTRQELAVVEERNRLSREIHDTLAQSLTALVMQLGLAARYASEEPGIARAQIDSASRLAQESLEEARRSVWNLHPQAPVSGSLSKALRDEVVRNRRQGLELSLSVDGEEPESIDERSELAVLRITQEALSNVRRHANAKTAVVRLAYSASGVGVVISDDGDGFEPSDTIGTLSRIGGGFGLTGMQERARMAGGHIEVHSAPGRGTQLEARIPYQPRLEKLPTHSETAAIAGLSQTEASPDIRVVIVDDQEVVRRGIRSMLELSDGLVVLGEAGDGEEAVNQIQTLAPDVVLLDIQMPKLDGVETIRRLRELGLETQIILLSVYAKDEYIFDGLRAGASGYLLKDVAADDLANAIRTVHGGGSLLQPVIAKRLIERLDAEAGAHLTDRELEVLRLLASGDRDSDIADKLSVTVRTIRFHAQNIYQKLGVRTRTQAARVATERGLLNG